MSTAHTAPDPASADVGGPRVRWAAILWGVTFAALAGVALWLVAIPEGRDVAAAWTDGWTPVTTVTVLAFLAGGALLVTGLAEFARRAQRERERHTP